MKNHKVKVLYVAGYERSGSTILHNVLGQIDGFFSVGELRVIWDRSLIENRPCGCGTVLQECEVWKRVFENEIFGGKHQINDEIIRLSKRARTRYLPLLLIPGGEQLLKSYLGEYLVSLEKLYQAVQSTTGSKVIVDSSKFPLYGYLLGMLPTIDLYVIHLIRDPRGAEYSILKRKDRGWGRFASRNSTKDSLRWSTLNLTIESLLRRASHHYLTLRYEDFVCRPQESVERILKLVQEEATSLPFVGEHKVKLGVTHTTGGNENRFESGIVELRADEEWKEKMQQIDKAIVTTLTWPLLLRYGYLSAVS